MAPHSSTLAWKIPRMEEPGRLQSMGSRRVRHDWVTSLSLFTFMHWRRKWQPTPVFLPGESQGRRVCGVAQSRTRLKRLSSSSSRVRIEYWQSGIWRREYIACLFQLLESAYLPGSWLHPSFLLLLSYLLLLFWIFVSFFRRTFVITLGPPEKSPH